MSCIFCKITHFYPDANSTGRQQRYCYVFACGGCNGSHRSFCQQYGDRGTYDADNRVDGNGEQEESVAAAYAIGVRKQYGRNADTHRYTA